jgi:GT2 family glycosyltransferase
MMAQDRSSGSRREPSVGILILNWNNWRDTLECLDSLQDLAYPHHRIILVDNGSTNDSIPRILDWCKSRSIPVSRCPAVPADSSPVPKGDPGTFILIETGKNLGYAGGNNVGMRLSLLLDDAFIWLLNNDTVVDPMALTYLVRTAASDDRMGMVGSFIDEGRSPGSGGRPGPEGSRHGVRKRLRFIPGASLLARSECIRDIGLIDEDYFLYWEEVDWCHRAKKKNWRLSIDPRSRVQHKLGASMSSKRIRKRSLGHFATRISWEGFPVPGYYETRNGVYFVKKHHPSCLVPYTILRTTRLLARVLIHDDHKLERCRIIMRGAWDGWRGRLGMTMDPSRPLDFLKGTRIPGNGSAGR